MPETIVSDRIIITEDERAASDLASLQKRKQLAWQNLGDESGQEVTRSQILEVLRAEHALGRIPFRSLRTPRTTRAAIDFFNQEFFAKDADYLSNPNDQTKREVNACSKAIAFLSASMLIRYQAPM